MDDAPKVDKDLNPLSPNDVFLLGERLKITADEFLKNKGYVWTGGVCGDKISFDSFKTDRFDLNERPITIRLEIP